MKKLKLTLVSAAALIGTLTAAQAVVLSSGPVFTFGQTTAVCHLTNAGQFPVRSGVLEIVEHGGNTVVASNNCGTIAKNGYCNAVANSLATVPYSCRITIIDDNVVVRGNLDIRDTSQLTRIVAPMH